MIRVVYFAAQVDSEKYGEFESSFFNIADRRYEQITNLLEYTSEIKIAKPISNYANFFGEGIDLFDSSVTLGSEDDYFGYITPIEAVGDAENVISITWEGTKAPDLSNGISVLFNKYTCRRARLISIDIENKRTLIKDVSDDNGLPENLHFDFSMSEQEVQDGYEIREFQIELWGIFEKKPVNIQGIALGRIIDIDNILSFDMLSETNPISDDLSINETNISAVIEDEFFSEYGQKVFMYDDEELLEEDVVKSIEETDVDTYDFKIRSLIENTDKIETTYPYVVPDIEHSWQNSEMQLYEILDAIYIDHGILIDVYANSDEDEDEAKITLLSQYHLPTTIRMLIQQVAWASCCGVDTTYNDEITLVPFFAKDNVSADIVITNDDDRILKTSVKKGDVYSKIIWRKTKYKFVGTEQDLGSYKISQTPQGPKQYGTSIVKDAPFEISRTSLNESNTVGLEYYFSPFRLEITADDVTVSEFSIEGWEAQKYEEIVEINTGNPNGETLEISNQTIYPIDDTDKIAQLKKWYSRNNTLSATVVDNESEIRVGKVVKIQLKKGNYFQGIVTSVVRNNVGDYHTVDLEAHEWN